MEQSSPNLMDLIAETVRSGIIRQTEYYRVRNEPSDGDTQTFTLPT